MSLKALVEHLSRIASHSDKNKMDAKNLAIVFSPVVFGEDEIPQGDLLSVQPMKVRSVLLHVFRSLSDQDSVMEDLIENAQTLFDERLPSSSPPLPPAPLGEPVPVIGYGSSHTKVTQPEEHVADFAPELPPRPTSSIHPSARYCPPMSPSRMPADLSAQNAQVPSALPPPTTLKVHISADGTEKPRQEQAGPDTKVSGAVERTPAEPRDFVSPPTVAHEQYREEHRSEVVSIPETPLTASSQTPSSRSFSE